MLSHGCLPTSHGCVTCVLHGRYTSWYGMRSHGCNNVSHGFWQMWSHGCIEFPYGCCHTATYLPTWHGCITCVSDGRYTAWYGLRSHGCYTVSHGFRQMWSHGCNGFPYGCCHTAVYLPDTGVSPVFYTSWYGTLSHGSLSTSSHGCITCVHTGLGCTGVCVYLTGV